jgi:hypothetical protein
VIQTCVSKRAIQNAERVSEQDIIAKIQVQEQKQDIGHVENGDIFTLSNPHYIKSGVFYDMVLDFL